MSTAWSDEELAASVQSYQKMLDNDRDGIRYVKTEIYKELARRFGRTAKAYEYRMTNISAVRRELGLPWVAGLLPLGNVGSEVRSRLITLITGEPPTKAQSVVGAKESPYWQKALQAVVELGGSASRKEVGSWIIEHDSDYNTKNLSDLYMMSVNSKARTGYERNKNPRRTDEGYACDCLFMLGGGRFELYEPEKHGVWEIYRDPASGSRLGVSVRKVSSLVDEALREAESEVTKTSYFDPTDSSDARKKVMTEIVRRRGQPAFRRALMSAYEGCCAITGCTLSAVLEAAHIYPYEGEHTNVVSNGLLLRADIHTLFDLGLIVIDSQSMTVQISVELQGTEYEALQGKPLRQTKNDFDQASAQSLDWHRSQFAKAS
ncbi:HNH endonuclease [Alcaligenes parafaecalis]|uniref:HNH endonuclease n=1 Tax=Alcaligenes parafaecalis TaxID=171260 RepID=A0ABT3VQW7_9BURK|nr:HNH endonuclease [Alcaligenes parafaecalis]MCX5465894.1 HNH endonuclease [Alcaligenes parafaecalis]